MLPSLVSQLIHVPANASDKHQQLLALPITCLLPVCSIHQLIQSYRVQMRSNTRRGGNEALSLGCAGGVLQGQFLDYTMVKQLEKMPTRAELMQKLARLIRKARTLFQLNLLCL